MTRRGQLCRPRKEQLEPIILRELVFSSDSSLIKVASIVGCGRVVEVSVFVKIKMQQRRIKSAALPQEMFLIH
jgi:hypothetical protein